jgi:hypothetical protein
MTGMQAAMLEAHEKNLKRYARLLTTELTQTEREYIHRRIAEERLALERVTAAEMHMPPPTAISDPARHL